MLATTQHKHGHTPLTVVGETASVDATTDAAAATAANHV